MRIDISYFLFHKRVRRGTNLIDETLLNSKVVYLKFQFQITNALDRDLNIEEIINWDKLWTRYNYFLQFNDDWGIIGIERSHCSLAMVLCKIHNLSWIYNLIDCFENSMDKSNQIKTIKQFNFTREKETLQQIQNKLKSMEKIFQVNVPSWKFTPQPFKVPQKPKFSHNKCFESLQLREISVQMQEGISSISQQVSQCQQRVQLIIEQLLRQNQNLKWQLRMNESKTMSDTKATFYSNCQ